MLRVKKMKTKTGKPKREEKPPVHECPIFDYKHWYVLLANNYKDFSVFC